MRKLLLLLPLFLPGPFKRAWYRWLLGWKIGRRVRIGFSYLDAREVDIGDNVRIGHFNVLKNVARLFIGHGTWISNFNTFSGNMYTGPGWVRTLIVGEECYIMSHHFIDVAGEVVLGRGTTLAGRSTQLWSHTIKMDEGRQELVPLNLHIGAGSYIGAHCTLLFCTMPDGCMVGAGSVVTKSFPPGEGRLVIAGNPAGVRKTYLAKPAAEDEQAKGAPGKD